MTDTVSLVPNQGWDARILVCRCGTLVDTFIVVSDRYVVLIDTLINRRTAEALLEIARPYLAGRQLLAVNTHADWDHAWGNHVFDGPSALLPTPIIASRLCAERLRSEAAQLKLAEMRASEPGRFGDVVLTPPSLLFEQQLVIDGGDLTLQLFATPGHKPDHIAIFIPEIRTLLPGDAAELPFPFVELPRISRPSVTGVPGVKVKVPAVWLIAPAELMVRLPLLTKISSSTVALPRSKSSAPATVALPSSVRRKLVCTVRPAPRCRALTGPSTGMA